MANAVLQKNAVTGHLVKNAVTGYLVMRNVRPVPPPKPPAETTMFAGLLDFAAKVAVDTFKMPGTYYYEDRKTERRYLIPPSVTETDLEIQETDKDGFVLVRKGKGFFVTRQMIKNIDAWRTSIGIDTRNAPTPYCRDRIIKETVTTTEIYEITAREPFSVIGPNKALYQINTFFDHEKAKPATTNP
jgi:hypothetical protein